MTEPAEDAGWMARRYYRRAVEAAIWGMPAASTQAMIEAFHDCGARFGDIVYFSRLPDWRWQITTPNATTYYAFSSLRLTDRPVILTLPPTEGSGLYGSIFDCWQNALADVGPAGEDAGRGGVYAILPPGYSGPVPDDAAIVRCPTRNAYILFRAIPADYGDEGVARTQAHIHGLRIAEMDATDEQRFIDIAGKPFEAFPEMDDTFFDRLAAILRDEPVGRTDLVAMGMAHTLGIGRDKPFEPDASQRETLARAAREAQAQMLADNLEINPLWPDRRWGSPTYIQHAQTAKPILSDERLDYDRRAALAYRMCGVPKTAGAARFFHVVCDSAGDPLRGDETYQLSIPTPVPARQFWALAIYDAVTFRFIRGAQAVEFNSLALPDDGTGRPVEIVFAPERPAGAQHWMETAPGHNWAAIFRLYGPDVAALEAGWKPEDIVRLAP
ncbi:DUF1254 domain-containing protein [Oricola sp.]|uniref:DUF1254 domain-containing protein n=1 Tax=Oricola sp. TaxID=1979950 RepID=UPI0025E61D3F|nr:DUF1254 domain-containing protein [Oricola sp.]MCI5078139.1 DUF1254 domain-containing protein [Oricola sp.]